MAAVECVRGFISERLTAAAAEIFGVFQQTIVQYEEEIERQRKLLDTILNPEIKLHRIDLPQQLNCKVEDVLSDQQLCDQKENSILDQSEAPQVKEEQQELCINHEGGQQHDLKEETDPSDGPVSHYDMIISHNAPQDLSQQQNGQEEEAPADQQLCNQERNSSLDQEEPEPLQDDAVPDVPKSLYDSEEHVVPETDNDSLRRTESVITDKIPDSLEALCDSSGNGPGDLSTSIEIASQRLKRGCPILAESNDESGDSENEYFPNPREESTDNDSSLESFVENKNKDKDASISQIQRETRQSRRFQTEPDSTQRFPDITTDATKDKMEALEEEPSVYVNPVLKKEDGSRSYDKKHCCFYCGQQVQKMSRHLIRKHYDKVEVATALSLPKNSKERRVQLEFIRNKGNFEHNTEVLESCRGKLIPLKQPKTKTEGQEFTHCVYCYGLFRRRVMWKHSPFCKFKPQASQQSKMDEPAPVGLSDAYWKFLSDRKQDKIAVAIKEDRCILEYGYRLFTKNEKVTSQHQRIRQKLRELGRLLVEAKKVSPVRTIKDLIKPEKYSLVVTAARSLVGFSDKTGKLHRPSLAFKVGYSLRSLAMFIKSEGLKTKDKKAVKDAEEFVKLYRKCWKCDTASQPLTQLDQTKLKSPLLLPFTQDVQNLHSYLSEKQQQHLNALTEESSPSHWKDLAKVILAQVMLFNYWRTGEVSTMPLSAYLSKDPPETHEDITLGLTSLEQKLCKHFVQITIVGKSGGKVPVLLTPLMRESLDILTEKREECGVLNENGYLFALPRSVHHLRGSDCIRQLVNECKDLKNPKALTSTKFRKHIAILSTILNLKATELDQLADFLGHNIAVQGKHYWLPEGTLQLAKISKVLLAMEQGHVGEYKGKSLDDIHLDVNETVDMERCSQEDMEDTEAIVDAHVSEDESTVTSLMECTSTSNNQRKEAKKRGKQRIVKKIWTPEESAAVERHLKGFIVMGQVPGKVDCENCIAAEPEALRNRDWKTVKYFINNRISIKRRKVQ